jgi:hypothetical protein
MDDTALAGGQLVIGLVIVLLLIIPVWKIFAKAGLGGAWSLLMLVPGIGPLIVILMLAFKRWPAVEG